MSRLKWPVSGNRFPAVMVVGIANGTPMASSFITLVPFRSRLQRGAGTGRGKGNPSRLAPVELRSGHDFRTLIYYPDSGGPVKRR